MNRKVLWSFSLAVVLMFGGCKDRESSVTAGFGDRAISGEVRVSGDSVDLSGMEVRARGTGIASMTNDKGKFLLAGLPERGVEIAVRRADGIDERVDVPDGPVRNFVIQVASRGRSRVRSVRKTFVQLEGTIDATDGSVIQLRTGNGAEVEVSVDDDTSVRRGDVQLQAADLLIGDHIHVKATRVGEVLVASTIFVQEDEDAGELEAEIAGEVVEINGDSLTVRLDSGELIIVHANADTIVLRSHVQVPFDDIVIGDRIEAEGLLAEDGALNARKIEIEDEDDDELIEVHGEIVEIGDSSFALKRNGKSTLVFVDDGAEIVRDGVSVSFADLEIGDEAVAFGTKTGAMSMLAMKVIAESPELETAEIKGVILRIGDGEMIVGKGNGEVFVDTKPETEIWKDGTPVDFGALMVGDHVRAEGEVTAEGILAWWIRAESPELEEEEIEGIIVGLGEGEMEVETEYGHVFVDTNGETEILKDGILVDFNALDVGDHVEAKGEVVGEGMILAWRIKAESPEPEDEEIEGVIVRLGEGEMEVETEYGHVFVDTNGETEILKDGVLVDFGALEAGDHVEAKGEVVGEGILAWWIKAESPEPE